MDFRFVRCRQTAAMLVPDPPAGGDAGSFGAALVAAVVGALVAVPVVAAGDALQAARIAAVTARPAITFPKLRGDRDRSPRGSNMGTRTSLHPSAAVSRPSRARRR